MKKLFLASIASLMMDKVVPLLPDDPHKLTVAFIPTASNPNNDKSWLQLERDAVLRLGMSIIELDIEGKTIDEVTKVLDQARKSGFDKAAIAFITAGKLYIGSSAGAALVCPTIAYVEGLDPQIVPKMNSFDALNIVDFLLLVHQGDPEADEAYNKIIPKWKDKGLELVYLTNKEALIVNGEERSKVSI